MSSLNQYAQNPIGSQTSYKPPCGYTGTTNCTVTDSTTGNNNQGVL